MRFRRSCCRNFTGTFFFLALLIGLVLSFQGTGTAADRFNFTILYMNDPHAHYLPYDAKGESGPIGGFAKAQTVMAQVKAANRAEGRKTFTFLAGDLLMGTPFSTLFKGRLGFKLLEEMKFTAMTVGNHEFDYGKDYLFTTLKPLATFPLLSANIRAENGEFVFQRTLEEPASKSAPKTVIIGLTTTETPTTTHPKNAVGLEFMDPVATAQELLKQAKDEDLVIAVTHLGIEEDKRLAESCPIIDIIVGGHSHVALAEPLQVNKTIICQAGAYAKFVGRLDVELVNGRVVRHTGKLILLGPEVKEDPAVAAIIAKHAEQLNKQLNVVIGRTEVYLDGNCRLAEAGVDTNLGRLVTFAMASSSGADVALLNAGAVRESILEGDITAADVYTAFPFGNTVVKMDLAGTDLLATLQRGADLEVGAGARLQTYGISYRVENGKVRIDSVRGKAFDPARVYSVATNDFLAAGGDGYTVLRDNGRNPYPSAMPVSDLVIGLVKEKKVITKELEKGLE